jgi:dTDP-4-amino-4,6-dideoxygalactose transaminase
LSLPIFPELTAAEQDAVVARLGQALQPAWAKAA